MGIIDNTPEVKVPWQPETPFTVRNMCGMPSIQEIPWRFPIAKSIGQQSGIRPEGIRISNRPFFGLGGVLFARV
jgi:hypothetical protein